MYQQCTIILWTDIFGKLKKWFNYSNSNCLWSGTRMKFFSRQLQSKHGWIGLRLRLAMDWKKTFSHEDPLSTQFSKCWSLPLLATHTLRKTCRYVRAVHAVQWRQYGETLSRGCLSTKETEEAVDRDVITFSSEIPADPVKSYLFDIVVTELVCSPYSYALIHILNGVSCGTESTHFWGCNDLMLW